MPSMANITIKKADGTTDIVYTALTPSAGDKVPAQWRVEAIGTVAGNRPVYSVTSRYTADKRARIVEGKLTYPETFTDTTTGIISVRNREVFSHSSIVHLDVADAIVSELAAQGANLIKSLLIQEVLKSGFSPT